MNLLTGKYEVKEAIQQFMKELPFNGELSSIYISKIPNAGYFDVELDDENNANFSIINYV